MNKKLKVTITTILAVGLLAIPVGSVALAAGPSNGSITYGNGNGTGICTLTGTDPSTSTSGGYYSLDVHEAICQLLGITTEELQSLRLEGVSLAEIAASYGVSEDTLVEAIMTVKSAAIQTQVEAGLITEAQAELRLQNMLEMTYRMIYSTNTGNSSGNMWGNSNGKGHRNGNGTGICTLTGDGTTTGSMQQHGKKSN